MKREKRCGRQGTGGIWALGTAISHCKWVTAADESRNSSVLRANTIAIVWFSSQVSNLVCFQKALARVSSNQHEKIDAWSRVGDLSQIPVLFVHHDVSTPCICVPWFRTILNASWKDEINLVIWTSALVRMSFCDLDARWYWEQLAT